MKRSPASFRSRSKPGNLELLFKMADNNKSQTDGRAQLVSAKGRYSGVILALPTFTTGVTTILVSRVISPLLLPLPPMHTPSHALFLRARSLECPLCESAISCSYLTVAVLHHHNSFVEKAVISSCGGKSFRRR